MEDNITDTDALKLIQSSYDGKKLKKDNQNKSQNSNMLILDADEEGQDQSVIDPFTYKLINFEVNNILFVFNLNVLLLICFFFFL